MKYEVVSQTQEKHPQPTGDVEGPGAPPSVNEVVLATVREGEPLQTLLGHLSGLQMQVHVCSEFRDIHRRLADNHCAILLLDEEPGRPDTGLSNDHLGRLLAEFPHLRIIALLPRGVPLGPRFSELLERGWIYDFHTLPLDVDRLSVMIGHLQGLVELERRQEGPGDNRRAGLPVCGIAEARRFTGAGLHGDRETELGELGNDLRSRSDPLLAGVNLRRDSNLHQGPLCSSRLPYWALRGPITARGTRTGTRL